MIEKEKRGVLLLYFRLGAAPWAGGKRGKGER